nr:NADH dehydrogenase subunit 6 [Muscidifurax similadanacus]
MMKYIYIIQINLLLFLVMNSLMIITMMIYSSYIHPLMLCLTLLLFSMFMSIDMSVYNYTHWFSYIMYLIIIGGLMVIFMYFISMMNNMKMYINWNKLIIMPIKVMMMFMFFYILLNSLSKNMFWVTNLNLLKMYFNEFNFTSYMYTLKNFPTIVMMLYLFLCLTLIVKIIINKKIMLRKIN